MSSPLEKKETGMTQIICYIYKVKYGPEKARFLVYLKYGPEKARFLVYFTHILCIYMESLKSFFEGTRF